MINKMRQFAPAIMWVVIIAFVGTIFLSWGMEFTGWQQDTGYIAKVGGEEIPLQRFDQMVNMERENQLMRAQGELPPQQSRMIPRQVLETEISRILLSRVFEQMKLGASAEEIFQYLRNNPPQEVMSVPQFQTDSVFDTSKFVQFLNTPESYQYEWLRTFEQHTGEMLIPMSTLQTLLESAKMPTRQEIAREYKEQNQEGVFEYVKASPSSFTIDSSEITDKMISQYYETHQDSFHSDRRASLKFIRIPKVPTPQDEQSFRDEMLQIKQRIQSGESTFAEEAEMESDDPGSAAKGGSLGWFGRGRMVKQFDDVAFSLDTGTISDPVKTQFGYHLIKVEDKRMKDDSVVQVKASHILRQVLPSIETIDSLEQLTDSVITESRNQGLAQAVEKSEFRVDSTGYFTRGDEIPKLGYLQGAASLAFNQEVGTIEKFEDTQAFYILQVSDRIQEGVLELSEVRGQIIKTLIDSLQRRKARNHLQSVLEDLPKEASLADLKERDSILVAGVTDTTTRSRYISGLGYNTPPVAAAFAAPIGQRTGIIESDEGYFSVKPLWREEIDSIPWESAEVRQIRQRMIQQERQRAYSEWYTHYKEQADVEDRLAEFYTE